MAIATAGRRMKATFSSNGQPAVVDRAAVARELAAEVQGVRNGLPMIFPTMTALLGRFDYPSLTSPARAMIAKELRQQNLSVYPTLDDVESDEAVCLSVENPGDFDVSEAITVRLLAPGEDPVDFRIGDEIPKGHVLWVEVDRLKATREALIETLAPLEPGLEESLIDDVLHLDPFPRVDAKKDTMHRSTSCVAVKAIERSANGTDGTVGKLAMQPVELLAGERWIISVWHQSKLCWDAKETTHDEDIADKEGIAGTVLGRWKNSELKSPGDIGVAIMYEVLCMYPDARRQLYVWHDRWEVALYQDFSKHMDNPGDDLERPDCRTLVDLRGLVSLFHQLVSPLDASGLNPTKFWFADVELDCAKALNASIGRSVSKLRELNEALRDDIDVLGLVLSNRQADQTDGLQLSLQVLAAPFVAAAIVVGGYGANTELPHRDDWWGFGIMVAVTILVAVLGYVLFVRYLRRARQRASHASSSTPRAGGSRPTALV